MTIDELFRGVVRGHKTVLALCILLPMIVAGVLLGMQQPHWSASVRIQVASEAPTSATQAEGLSSRVFAIATTPALLAKAMHTVRVSAPVSEVAKHVTAQRLGESPVVRLSYTGTDPSVTKGLVKALAQRVEAFMNQGDRDHFASVLAGVDARIADAQAAHAKLLDQLGKTANLIARSNLRISLGQTEAQMSQLASDRSGLLVSDTERDQSVSIDGNQPDVQRVPRGLLPKLALAGVFGIILGLTMASGLEMARPRLRGPRAMARALRTPVLGAANQPPPVLAASVALAARRSGVETVVLVAADNRTRQKVLRVLTLFGRLVPAPNRRAVEVRHPVPGDRDGDYAPMASSDSRPIDGRPDEKGSIDPFGTVRFMGMGDLQPDDELSAGIVVLTPAVLMRKDLDQVEDLIQTARWPLLGIIDASRSPAGGTP